MAYDLGLRSIKLGHSADPTKNFLIEVPVTPDGSLSIKTESGVPVFSRSAAGVITLGVAQTWQDMTASRAFGGGPYTNNTGVPITIKVTFTCTALELVGMTATIAGVAMPTENFYSPGAGYVFGIQWVVPAGATYSVACAKALAKWMELR